MRLVVLLEALKLVDEGPSHSVKWGHLVRSYCHFHVVHVLYDGVELLIFDSGQWFYHHKVLLLFFVLVDHLLNWIEVLLVREVNVI